MKYLKCLIHFIEKEIIIFTCLVKTLLFNNIGYVHISLFLRIVRQQKDSQSKIFFIFKAALSNDNLFSIFGFHFFIIDIEEALLQ